MITVFDNLPDLSLIEIFSYLSCVDVLWAFNNINVRLITLLTELGFYRHVNLSSTRCYRFQTILSLLRLNEIQSLIIDCYASPIQLSKWPFLPNLQTLRLNGVRDVVDVFNFAQQHAKTLIHLTVESSNDFYTAGITKNIYHPTWNLHIFIQKVLHNLYALRCLDLGMETTFFLHLWPLKTIQTSLIYLRITLTRTQDLINIMSTKPLTYTLQQLHIKMNACHDINYSLRDKYRLPRMEALHTFTFLKSFRSYSNEEWTFLDVLTASNVMPILRRIHFSIVVVRDDLDRMTDSALFTDYRDVDIHYALIIDDNRQHFEFSEYVPRGSRSHPRQIVGATFMYDLEPHAQPFTTTEQFCFDKQKKPYHLFYTLPWIIGDFHIFPSSATFFSHVMFANQITKLHSLQCDRRISVNLPNVTHLILTDSLDSLNSCLLSTNIRSIQITLNHHWLYCEQNDWTVLRRLSKLSMLKSLRVLLYDMHIPPDDTSCQMITQAALMVSDFCFCFRRREYQDDYDIDSAYTKHSLFIEQLRNCILAVPLIEQPHIVVEKDSCGIIIWF